MGSKKQFQGSELKRQNFLSYSPTGMLQGEVEDGFQLALVFHRCVVLTPSGIDRGYGHLEAKNKEETRKKSCRRPSSATSTQGKVSDKNLCLVSLLTLPTKPSHELNHFQNKPTAAGAGWGFHSFPGKRRNKIPKATAAFRSGHTGTVWCLLVDPVLEVAFCQLPQLPNPYSWEEKVKRNRK